MNEADVIKELSIKPDKAQFPTFRGNKRDLEYVKELAEKHNVTYSKMMNMVVLVAKGKFESSAMGLGK